MPFPPPPATEVEPPCSPAFRPALDVPAVLDDAPPLASELPPELASGSELD
jgi:hypothetical protein